MNTGIVSWLFCDCLKRGKFTLPATFMGASLLEAGLDEEEVMEMVIYKGLENFTGKESEETS